MSCRTNWAVRGNWADTGDLNALESFSLHSITWMVGEPMESILMGGDVVCEHREWEVVRLWWCGMRHSRLLQGAVSGVQSWKNRPGDGLCSRCGC